ncbi:Cytochrome P450 18a1 [Camponotus floridanus]|uniref:Cytochrome P450 18a1 n=2 Tax=Camponotus floridanus TaxID=104421 RepID=E1ZW76_CAMFO|nr:Cytochrome P450 18a1 [Camponotus floridanus]
MLEYPLMQASWHEMGKIDIVYILVEFSSVFLFVRLFINWIKYICSLPPGPWGLPLVGYLPFINGSDLHLQYCEMAQKYGPIFCARLGNQLVVVVSDYRIIRDMFRREEFTGRPHIEFTNILDGYGIVNTEGALWKDQRRFLHNKLRCFGMTNLSAKNKSLESKIMNEVVTFLRGLAVRHGTPINISLPLGMSISNVICTLLMGMRFHHSEWRFKRFMALIEEGFKYFAKIALINYLWPFINYLLRFLPCMQVTRNKISQNRAEMANFFQETIDQHRATFNRNNVRDIVDTYLLEIEQAKEEGREEQLFEGKNHDRQMQQILGDLFSAGMETVKTTLEWAVIFMLHYPKAAKAVQRELDEVVGRARMPTLEDLPFLPITEATILEILRKSSIVPLGTTHATTRDTTLNGYAIPAGTQIVPLLHAVHMDPKLWDEPEVFRPSRFLSSEGKICKPEYFMPFGVGRRMCLGEVLARMEIFLFFGSLMHTFDLSLPEGASLPSLRGNAGITISPDPFKVCFLQRDFNVECGSNEVTTGGPLRNVGSH